MIPCVCIVWIRNWTDFPLADNILFFFHSLIYLFPKLTTPSEVASSNPRNAGTAGGAVRMSRGSQSPREGESPWPERWRPPRVPRRGLPRRTLRPDRKEDFFFLVSFFLLFYSIFGVFLLFFFSKLYRAWKFEFNQLGVEISKNRVSFISFLSKQSFVESFFFFRSLLSNWLFHYICEQ